MAAAKDKTGAENQNPPEPDETKKTKSVRVICEGVLGPKGLVKGEVTDAPEYVALLKVKGQKKVEEVK